MKCSYKAVLGIFIALFASGGQINAQGGLNLWSSAELNYKINKRVKLSLSEELRLRENLAKTDRFETSLEATYKLFSFIKVGAGYSLLNYNHPRKGWEIRHRVNLSVEGEYSIGRFDLAIREQYQNTYRVGITGTSERLNPKMYVRSRLSVSYNISGSRIYPYTSAEFYHTVNSPVENELSKIRYTLGTKYKLSKRNSLNLYYRYVTEKEDDDIEGSNIIGIGYTINIR